MIRDHELEWFRPVSRRYGVTIFLFVWTCWEWFGVGSPFWGTLAGAMGIYAYYRLILNFPPEPPSEK